MSGSELIESLFNLFSTFLSSELTLKRSPYKFLDSVNQPRSMQNPTTSQIFLDISFQTWVAYFVLKPGSANTNGQSARRQLFASLDTLSAEERANLAKRVDAVPLHLTVARLIQSMQQQMNQQSMTGSVSSKRRRTEDPPPASLYTNDSFQNNQRVYHNALQTNNDSTCLQEIISGADVEELGLFPEYLRSAIRRNDTGDHKTAAVSMNFPSHVIADVDCIMTMEVYPNKVERLALLIFNAHLETNGEVRELVIPGGLKVIASQLQGSPPESFTNVFGRVTAAALESAPYRRVEVLEADAQEQLLP